MQYLISILIFGAIWATLVLSLNLLMGYGGQVSLGHAAFFGIGAYTAAILSAWHGVSFLWTLPAAMAVTALCGAVLGLPSLRVRHDFLVLATIGLNFIVVGILQYTDWFGGSMGIVGIPVPQVLGFALKGGAYLVVVAACAALTAWISSALHSTWGGLALFAVRDDERAAESVGISHARYKIAAFAISGAFAGLAGALYAPFVGNVFPERFGFLESITLVSMLVFGGVGTIRGALFGGVFLKALPEYLRFSGEYRFALYGIALILLMVFQPQGLLGDGSFFWTRVLRLRAGIRRQGTPEAPPAVGGKPAGPLLGAEPQAVDRPGGFRPAGVLAVHDVTVDFGGLRALDGVNLELRSGEILGLIGPNGAGKTTLFNAITGVVPVSAGRITLNGQDIQGLGPHRVARSGVTRTFQIVRPFRSLDVQHNILSGGGVSHYARARAFFRRHAGGLAGAAELGRQSGLGGLERMSSAQLPIGLLRRLEVGRALATGGTFVLLDEPAAGLTYEEVEELRDLVRGIARGGKGVILVEHNMRFAMEVCDRLVVLAAGRVLAVGPPTEVRHNPLVIEAYLGGGA